jgi:hypothetical protein
LENDEKVMITKEQEENHETIDVTNLDPDEILSPLVQFHSPRTIISTILDHVLTQIESNENNSQLNSLPIIEDDQLDVEDDDDEDDDENEEEDEEENSSNKSIKIEKERSVTKISSIKGDSKPTTRTLRSHARKKIDLSTSNPNNNIRRVSNRRRALEKKLLLATHEKEKKRKLMPERVKKDKDNLAINDEMQTSSNSDDQTTEPTNMEKVSNPNDDVSSSSSIGAGDGSSTSSSTINIKQSNPSMEYLPPNKRQLRERNAGLINASENSSIETNTTREIPMNNIKQFLQIRQQIDKRHETMLQEFVLPKLPKDFSETTMAKKSYLIASSFSSYSSTTPASIGIKRYSAPHDLDPHLAEVFTKQEDERYRMKLRHQVERDKLILSHEQEVLRLCGNATRSSVNQDIPFSYCSLMKDNEVYNNPSIQLPEKFIHNDYTNTELGKRGKHRWNGRSFIKWLEDSNLKYKRLSCEINERQRLEADTLYSMQRMVWLKHLPKESTNLSLSGRMSYLLTERYLPKVEINSNFWTNWDTSPF